MCHIHGENNVKADILSRFYVAFKTAHVIMAGSFVGR